MLVGDDDDDVGICRQKDTKGEGSQGGEEDSRQRSLMTG